MKVKEIKKLIGRYASRSYSAKKTMSLVQQKSAVQPAWQQACSAGIKMVSILQERKGVPTLRGCSKTWRKSGLVYAPGFTFRFITCDRVIYGV